MTGLEKTNQIVTVGLFPSIASANSYIHALPMHSAITRVNFCRVSSADPVKSDLETVDSMEGRKCMGLNVTPMLIRLLLGPLACLSL